MLNTEGVQTGLCCQFENSVLKQLDLLDTEVSALKQHLLDAEVCCRWDIDRVK